MFFTAYIDDSGTAPDQKVANATAFLIPASRICRLEAEWELLKKKEGFTFFHTSEFVSKNPKWEFAKWDDKKRERVFRKILRICKSYGKNAISFTVNKEDFLDVVPEQLLKHMGKYPFTWAMRFVVSHLDEWRIWQRLNPRPEFRYVFARMGPPREARLEVVEVMEQAEYNAELNGNPGGYLRHGFEDPREIYGLQCMDVIAWTCYQTALEYFIDTPPHPFAKMAWKYFGGFNHPRDRWLHAVTVTRPKLKEFIARIEKDGTAIRMFEEWSKRK